MAFRALSIGDSVSIPIKDGVTLATGVLVEIEAATNRADLLATNNSSRGIGLCIVGGTGNSAGTVFATVQVLGPQSVLETEWATAALPGAELDIASGSAGVTTDSNHDVLVLSQANGIIRLVVLASRMINY